VAVSFLTWILFVEGARGLFWRFFSRRALRIRRRIWRFERGCVCRAYRRSFLVCTRSDTHWVVSPLAHSKNLPRRFATHLVVISQAFDPLHKWHSRTRTTRAFEGCVWSVAGILVCSDRETNFLCGILQVEKMFMSSTAYRLQRHLPCVHTVFFTRACYQGNLGSMDNTEFHTSWTDQ